MTLTTKIDQFRSDGSYTASKNGAGGDREITAGRIDLRPQIPTASRVLIVDGQEVNRRMLRATLKPAAYKILECGRASEAISLLEREDVDVIILDLVLPEVSGPELCRALKSNRRTQFIPLLMLTSVQGVENEIVSISSGADEFLIKPVHPSVVRIRVAAMLRTKALIDSLEEAENILFALARAVEHRDKNTGMHCERLAAYSVLLGQALGLSPPELQALYRGGYLHDIGKISVPDAILFKAGPLLESEWEVMRAHTIQGENICRPMKSLWPVLPIIRSHHERWDGTGYPDGLRGNDIPLLARILQIVDIYDALTTKRPYKPAIPTDEALRMMSDEADKGWRDPQLVNLFIKIVDSCDFPELDSAPILDSLINMQAQLAV